MTFSRFVCPIVALTLAAMAWSTELRVEIGSSRARDDSMARAEAAMRLFSKNAARLTARSRAAARSATPFSLPARIVLTRNGTPLGGDTGRGRGADIALVFDTSGPRTFPAAYRTLLQDVFQRAKPALDAVFGSPSVGGNVRVANYESDIGERDAVAGGFYVPNNGTGEQEIRFPIYADQFGIKGEVAAVNFLHCLLLAYLGPRAYPWDAFNEGLVRAATMKVARTPSAMLATLDPEAIEGVLASTYDMGASYDWNNQPALGGSTFIAPNLKNQPLPIGGSTGGIYLLRYQMAGTAWQKVLVEYPQFAAEFNARYYANPNVFQTRAALVGLGQTVISQFAGGSATIEGLSFSDWFRRQGILETRTVPGLKLQVQPFPIVDGLGGSDFGVFGVQAHAFTTDAAGNETLLTGTSYPIFWTPEFFRVFTSAQEDRMDYQGGYGSVAPNFPGSLFNNEPYRVAVDIPFQDQIARCYLPAGSIATASNPIPNNFYGTVSGSPGGTGVSFTVKVAWQGGQRSDIPVKNFAFGAKIEDTGFDDAQRLTIEVRRVQGNRSDLVLTRKLNKGPGPIGVDLRVNEADTYSIPGGLPRGVGLIGLPIDPYASSAADLFQLTDAATQAARWNGLRGRFEFFPECGAFRQGLGFFVRGETAKSIDIAGRALPNTPVAVALRPGWNLVANPLQESVPTSRIQVAVAADFPTPYEAAKGQSIGTEFFAFTPGAVDPVSGAPEGGTFGAAATFEPGRGYFVRVFAPEGATLLFSPTHGQSRSPAPPRAAPPGWELLAQCSGGGESSEVRIAQHPRATNSFDRSADTELPPAFNGMQARLGTTTALYRDARMLGAAATYKLQLDRIRTGTVYTLRFSRVTGTIGRFTVRDLETGTRTTFTGGGTLTVRARSATRAFEVTFQAGNR